MSDKIKLKRKNPFVIVSHDFIKCDFLNWNEKDIYMILLMYADSESKCFPSINKLCEISGKANKTVIKGLKGLEEKKLLEKINRTTKNGKTSNLYILNDFENVWKAKNKKEIKEIVDIEKKKKQLYELALELNFEIKEKEPETTEQPTKAPVETSPKPNQSDVVNTDKVNTTVTNTTPDLRKSQDSERYTLEQIRQLYEYDIMVFDEPTKQSDIDTVIEILHTTLNTTKNTIRVGGENKPTMSVISKLMKLDKDCILYAIDKFGEQTERIKNPTNYMLTLLYNSKEQMNLDITNKVQFDMYNNNAMCDDSTSSNSDVKNYEQQEQPTKASKSNITNEFNNLSQKEYSENKMSELEKMLLQRK